MGDSLINFSGGDVGKLCAEELVPFNVRLKMIRYFQFCSGKSSHHRKTKNWSKVIFTEVPLLLKNSPTYTASMKNDKI